MVDVSDQQRRELASKGQAMRGGRFPVRNRADLQRAIHAVGRAKGGESGRATVRRYLIRRARSLQAANLIPDSWNQDGSLKG